MENRQLGSVATLHRQHSIIVQEKSYQATATSDEKTFFVRFAYYQATVTIENHCSHYESVQTADMSMIRWTQLM